MKKALFLDRDGVINIDYGYVYQIEKFEFFSEIFDIVKMFKDRGYLIIVVTNQSGIGRGYYSQEDFLKLTKYMKDEFKKRDLAIDEVYYCPHIVKDNCKCRKPYTKMVDDAKEKFNIDLANSWLVGDKQSDINLAKNAGIGVSVGIGDRVITDATYRFKTIKEFKTFLSNNDKIV